MRARLSSIWEKIHSSAANCGRDPQLVKLVAVSKTQPVEVVREAVSAGVNIVGENYIQEAKEKYNALYREPVIWHFIGHLQSNKAKYAVRMFDLIHSVDSLKVAAELDKQAVKIGKVQKILIQVNVGKESSKTGALPEKTLSLIRQAAEYKNISIRGLMTMPPFFDEAERVRPYFSNLRKLSERIASECIPGISMQELSMGMSGDFQTAIEEGATLVRVGTAIFGERR